MNALEYPVFIGIQPHRNDSTKTMCSWLHVSTHVCTIGSTARQADLGRKEHHEFPRHLPQKTATHGSHQRCSLGSARQMTSRQRRRHNPVSGSSYTSSVQVLEPRKSNTNREVCDMTIDRDSLRNAIAAYDGAAAQDDGLLDAVIQHVSAVAVEGEAEWEYGKTLRGKSDNPAVVPSREQAESETDEWNYHFRPRLKKQGERDPGEGIVVRRRKAGPWEDVPSA